MKNDVHLSAARKTKRDRLMRGIKGKPILEQLIDQYRVQLFAIRSIKPTAHSAEFVLPVFIDRPPDNGGAYLPVDKAMENKRLLK